MNGNDRSRAFSQDSNIGIEDLDEDSTAGRPKITMHDPRMLFNDETQYDFNSEADVEKLIKKYSRNYHKNLFDLNVKYDLQKLKVARMLHAVEQKLYADVTDYTLRLKKFKSSIKKEDGKLTLLDLNKLNSVFKKNYV